MGWAHKQLVLASDTQQDFPHQIALHGLHLYGWTKCRDRTAMAHRLDISARYTDFPQEDPPFVVGFEDEGQVLRAILS